MPFAAVRCPAGCGSARNRVPGMHAPPVQGMPPRLPPLLHPLHPGIPRPGQRLQRASLRQGQERPRPPPRGPGRAARGRRPLSATVRDSHMSPTALAPERMMAQGHIRSHLGKQRSVLGTSIRTVWRWEEAGRLKPMTRLPAGQRRCSGSRRPAPVEDRGGGVMRPLRCRVREAGRGGQPAARQRSAWWRRREPRGTPLWLSWQSKPPA